jgi:hypothetical protein
VLEALPAAQADVAFAVGANATLKLQLALAASDAAQEEFAMVKSEVLPFVKPAATPLIALAVLLLSSKGSGELLPPMTWSQNTVVPVVQEAGEVRVTPVAGTPMPLNFRTWRMPWLATKRSP